MLLFVDQGAELGANADVDGTIIGIFFIGGDAVAKTFLLEKPFEDIFQGDILASEGEFSIA